MSPIPRAYGLQSANASSTNGFFNSGGSHPVNLTIPLHGGGIKLLTVTLQDSDNPDVDETISFDDVGLVDGANGFSPSDVGVFRKLSRTGWDMDGNGSNYGWDIFWWITPGGVRFAFQAKKDNATNATGQFLNITAEYFV